MLTVVVGLVTDINEISKENTGSDDQENSCRQFSGRCFVAWVVYGESSTVTVLWKAFAWTAIPIVTLSIVSTAGAGYGEFGVKFWIGFYVVWYLAAAVWLVATIATVVLYARGKRESASGVFAGVGVGLLAVGITGLVNFATIQATFQ